jgi:uncharacterized repeat protein (TIGR01451 family)
MTLRVRSTLIAVAAFLGGSVMMLTPAPANAAGPAPKPSTDVAVTLTQPGGVYVGQPGVYTAAVTNLGPKTAEGVSLTIALPRTHTSPTVLVMGTVSGIDGRCTRTGTNLVCALGSLRRGASTSVQYTIALPQSAAPLTTTASIAITNGDSNAANDTDAEVANLLHPSTPVVVGKTAQADHCTGTALTSFFECAAFPSSIASFQFVFGTGGAVTLVGAPVGYGATWSQAAGTQRLSMQFTDTGSVVGNFDGWAVSASCWEGVTTFTGGSSYVSPYKVCMLP